MSNARHPTRDDAPRVPKLVRIKVADYDPAAKVPVVFTKRLAELPPPVEKPEAMVTFKCKDGTTASFRRRKVTARKVRKESA